MDGWISPVSALKKLTAHEEDRHGNRYLPELTCCWNRIWSRMPWEAREMEVLSQHGSLANCSWKKECLS